MFGNRCRFEHAAQGQNYKLKIHKDNDRTETKYKEKSTLLEKHEKRKEKEISQHENIQFNPEHRLFLDAIIKKNNLTYISANKNIWKDIVSYLAAIQNLRDLQSSKYLTPVIMVFRDLPLTTSNLPNIASYTKLLNVYALKCTLKECTEIFELINSKLCLLSQLSVTRETIPLEMLPLIEGERASLEKTVMSKIEGKIENFNLAKEYTDVLTKFKNVLNELKMILETAGIQSNTVFQAHDAGIDSWYVNPTVKWLTQSGSDSWFQNMRLKEQYVSCEDYVLVLRTLWSYLTFYWGRGALWPKCKELDQRGKVCNSPLFSIPKGSSHCNRRNCTGIGEWTCPVFQHKYSLCNKCVESKVANCLCGNERDQNQETSTDVYDATVFDVTRSKKYLADSFIIRVENVLSRKQPKEKVNWRTTYRLQESCLVGIVRIAGNKAAIGLESPIYFGEIIFEKEDHIEYSRKSKGQLTIRLLSKSDSELFQTYLYTPFQKGSKLAVIDFRVFVPEVISVLSILFHPNFKQSLETIPFSSLLLGGRIAEKALQFPPDDLEKAVRSAIESSTIPALHGKKKEQLDTIVRDILNLSVVKTLDKTQLQAFCHGLSSPFHCTQGPPGTGKSYVGVCLVLAFVIIKRVFGIRGPILTLSYKNHALDEFLKDILSNGIRRGLIRVGKADIPELYDYQEKRSHEEADALQKLKEHLEILSKSQHLLHQFSLWKKSNFHESFNEIVKKFFGLHMYVQLKGEETKSPETCFQLLESTLTYSRQKEIPLKFIEDVAHWKGPNEQDRVVYLFYQWMNGSNPPPRCSFIGMEREEKCMKCAFAGSEYCEDHKCSYLGCVLKPKEYSHFCSTHCCTFPTCYEIRRAFNIPFCANHLCCLCLECTTLKNGSKTCKLHQCFACENVQIYGLQQCVEHVCLKCLEENKLDSGSRIQRGKYCSKHGCIEENCNETVVDSSLYCFQHLCFIDGCTNPRASNGREYCQSHLCSDPSGDCLESKVLLSSGKESPFCVYHTCRVCVENSEDEIGFGKDRSACVNHPLCQSTLRGTYCPESVFREIHPLFCQEHIPKKLDKCQALTKKGKPCQNKPETNQPYCKDHLNFRAQVPTKRILRSIEFVPRDRLFLPSSDLKTVLAQTKALLRCDGEGCEIYCKVRTQDSRSEWQCMHHNIKSDIKWEDKQKLKEDPICDPPTNQSIIGPLSSTIVSKPHREKTQLVYRREYEDDIDDTQLLVSEEPNGNVDKDELEDSAGLVYPQGQGDEDDENEENDDRNHNKQVFEEINDEEELNESERNAENTLELDELYENSLKDLTLIQCWENIRSFDLSRITWDETEISNRNEVFRRIFDYFFQFLVLLVREADRFVDTIRQEKDEASSIIFREATVIGATVVGAARRLKALRAAQPFAIIVEEACEVMEPTLISVLAVQSLQKLELVGDQRQLPAFVQNCWYNVEITNRSLIRSLFERLIHSSGECTVLDVQRRMRSSIAALTKAHYKDLIEIIDDPRTFTQKIGDRVNQTSALDAVRKTWERNGREVPGCQSSIYYWNIENNEEMKQPKVGLSACNEVEALAVVSLVKYLLTCGVPKACITIITPYKGQKRLLVSKMRDSKIIEAFSANHKPSNDTVIISTVDQYQGDENDIIILSMVRTKPGNRFVNLINRFIVSFSRARLGFYIIGSTKAVVEGYVEGENNFDQLKGGAHWINLMKQLQNPLFTFKDDGYFGRRISSNFPICCPMHSSCRSEIASNKLSEFPNVLNWSSFCSSICTLKFQCGHSCKSSCHQYEMKQHEFTNKLCEEKLKRPCEIHHHLPVLCRELTLRGKTVEEALRLYECSEDVSIRYHSCAHSYVAPCHVGKAVINGRTHSFSIPKCLKSVPPFVLACGHERTDLKCYERQEMQKSPPRCFESVRSKRLTCEHIVKSPCFTLQTALSRPCMETFNFKRPRCCHINLSIECHTFQSFKNKWEVRTGRVLVDRESASPITNVYERQNSLVSETSIEPMIPECDVPVTYIRSCSHEIKNVPCGTAFAYSRCEKTLNELCSELEKSKCKICDGDVSIPCHRLKEYNEWKPQVIAELHRSVSGTRITFDETHINNIRAMGITSKDKTLFRLLEDQCQSSFYVKRACGKHNSKVNCGSLGRLITGDSVFRECKTDTPRVLSCGHIVIVPCNEMDQPPPLCRSKPNEPYIFPKCGHKRVAPTCWELQEWKEKNNILCTELTTGSLPRCQHPVDVKCQELTRLVPVRGAVGLNNDVVVENNLYCQPCADMPPCVWKVSFKRSNCGHVLNGIECHKAFSWTRNFPGEAPKCMEKRSQIHPLCGHVATIDCWVTKPLSKWEPFNGSSLSFIPFRLREGPEGARQCILSSELTMLSSLSQLPASIPKASVECKEKVYVHCERCSNLRVSACSSLLLQPDGYSCLNALTFICPEENCGAERKYSCSDFHRLTEEEKRRNCTNKVQKICSVCGINKTVVSCNEQRPFCGREISSYRLHECGHLVSWVCGTDPHIPAFSDPGLKRNKFCPECVVDSWRMVQNNFSFNDVPLPELHQFCLERLRSALPSMTFTMVPPHSKDVSLQEIDNAVVPVNLNSLLLHHEATKNILVDSLIAAILSKSCTDLIEPPKLSRTENLTVMKKFYDLVVQPILDRETPFSSILTEYGDGTRVFQCDQNSLKKILKHNRDENLHLAIGLAFHCRSMKDPSAFTSIPSEKLVSFGNEKKNQSNPKGKKKATIVIPEAEIEDIYLTKERYCSEGYDSVSLSKTQELILWNASAVLPIFAVDIRVAPCCTCFDFFPRHGNFHGMFCEQPPPNGVPHFTCWVCIQRTIQMIRKNPSVECKSYLTTDKQYLLCQGCKSENHQSKLPSIPDQNGELSVPGMIADFCNLYASFLREEAVLEAQHEAAVIWQRKLDEVTKLEGIAREARLLKETIVNEIFMNICPNRSCKMPFEDEFSACFLVTCENCNSGFCAWCLAFPATLQHVVSCSANPQKGNVYGSIPELIKHRNKRRLRNVQLLMQGKSAEVKQKVKEIARREFEHIGIVMDF